MTEWKDFFNGFAPNYDDECFTKNTDREIEFLIEEFQLPTGATILDIGCGTGRHSIGLAMKGYRVTGVDISQEMLKIAEEKMKILKVEVSFVCANAKDYTADKLFDGAICLCEGAMCLLGSEDDPMERDLGIMKNVHRSLKSNGKFILNVINGCRHLRAITDQDIAEGKYDLLSMIELSEMEITTPEGVKRLQVRERGYTPPELRRILELAGFHVEHIYGGTANAWNRETPKLDEIELMAIVRRI